MARLSIGEFARACGLSPKALRLYDELGLLPPAQVDPHTGYRGYHESQLERAQLVAWLRGLGMPLARIRIVCDLPARAAAAEVSTYWRQVEADTAARKELATFLVDHLSERDIAMADQDTPLEIRCAAGTDRGLVRESNQDSAFAGTRLVAVADGFGPPDKPGTASTVAVDALRALDSEPPGGDLLKVSARWHAMQARRSPTSRPSSRIPARR